MSDEKQSFTFRVETALYQAFSDACKRNDMTASQLLRAYMRDYVKENSQAELPLGKPKRKVK